MENSEGKKIQKGIFNFIKNSMISEMESIV